MLVKVFVQIKYICLERLENVFGHRKWSFNMLSWLTQDSFVIKFTMICWDSCSTSFSGQCFKYHWFSFFKGKHITVDVSSAPSRQGEQTSRSQETTKAMPLPGNQQLNKAKKKAYKQMKKQQKRAGNAITECLQQRMLASGLMEWKI